jgi:opacity protein-like surface antigen
MKRSLAAMLLVLALLAAAAAPASAQIFSGLGDAAPGEDGVSFLILYGQMSPQSEFRDGSTFDASGGLGVGVNFWAARVLGFGVSVMRTNHVGLAASDGRSSVVSGRDPRIDTYLIDMIGRWPLVQEGAVIVSPYVAIGGGWKSYDFKWDTKGGPDARGMDLTWGPAGGVEARFGAQHRFGVRAEFRQLMTKMERWGDALTFEDRVLRGGVLLNF